MHTEFMDGILTACPFLNLSVIEPPTSPRTSCAYVTSASGAVAGAAMSNGLVVAVTGSLTVRLSGVNVRPVPIGFPGLISTTCLYCLTCMGRNDEGPRQVQHQELSLEQRIELMEQNLREIRDTQDVMVEHLQVILLAMNLKDQYRVLDSKYDRIKSGLDPDKFDDEIKRVKASMVRPGRQITRTPKKNGSS